MRRSTRGMRADLRTVFVPGYSVRTSYVDRSGLRTRREWLRLQAQIRSQ